MTTAPAAVPTATQRTAGFPLWLRDIDASLPTTGQYVVHGALRDVQIIGPSLLDTYAALWLTLERSGFRALLVHSPAGLNVWPSTEDARQAVQTALGPHVGTLAATTTHAELATVVEAVTRSNVPVALVIDYVSQAQPVGDPPSEALHALMLTSLATVHAGFKHPHPGARSVPLRHPVFWLVDRPGDLPGWMLSGDGIRQVPVPAPDLDTRRLAARLIAGALPGMPAGALGSTPGRATGTAATPAEEIITRFAEATDGLSIRAMAEIAQLARDSGIPATRIEDCVRSYRVGLTENPWQAAFVRDRIGRGEELLSGQVYGQPRAIRKTLDILVRSTTGLTSAHQRRPGTGPRGVLFFAGPTGVGKTELAKAVTRLVFGDQDAFVRFDMSEFASEHAEARLLGAPPGYVGHGSGGELTSAVRRRPFTVVLFDEIEKAHPRIMDKFLQVLSDGRLTDGSGATVYFSEAIIVFTSNLGAGEVDVSHLPPAEQPAAFEDAIQASVEHHFTERLGRPELLGRIGDNIVVFQPMRPDIARTLAASYLRNVAARVQEELGITVVVPPTVADRIIAATTADLTKGGRGIGMNVESLYVNPLARALFPLSRPCTVTVTGIGQDADGSPVVRLG